MTRALTSSAVVPYGAWSCRHDVAVPTYEGAARRTDPPGTGVLQRDWRVGNDHAVVRKFILHRPHPLQALSGEKQSRRYLRLPDVDHRSLSMLSRRDRRCVDDQLIVPIGKLIKIFSLNMRPSNDARLRPVIDDIARWTQNVTPWSRPLDDLLVFHGLYRCSRKVLPQSF